MRHTHFEMWNAAGRVQPAVAVAYGRRQFDQTRRAGLAFVQERLCFFKRKRSWRGAQLLPRTYRCIEMYHSDEACI